jgi:hypothetical protein
MHFQIQITLDQPLLSNDIEIKIDNNVVNFVLNYETITVEYPSLGFFHMLELKNITGKRFCVKSVDIGGCDLRKLIYLSYVQNKDGQTFQPATELWEQQQVWILPFGYPLSGWLETVEKKITNDLFGQDLISRFKFFYPPSVKLDSDKFPQMVRDFFEHNFSFTITDRTVVDPLQIPYMSYNKLVDSELIELARQEIINNIEYVMDHGLSYGQFQANKAEYSFESTNSCWRIIWLSKDKKPTDAGPNFPAVNKLVESLNLDHWYVFVGLLPPGGFIYPHLDYDTKLASVEEYKHYQGCTQLYIPLQWPKHNYIKFGGAGIVSLESGQAMVINNDNFVHSVVNAGDQTRIVLSVRARHSILENCVFSDSQFHHNK